MKYNMSKPSNTMMQEQPLYDETGHVAFYQLPYMEQHRQLLYLLTKEQALCGTLERVDDHIVITVNTEMQGRLYRIASGYQFESIAQGKHTCLILRSEEQFDLSCGTQIFGRLDLRSFEHIHIELDDENHLHLLLLLAVLSWELEKK
ncbi:MAG: hypothetical protein ACRCZJ_04415 [Erysipelotrichaceae bacterium]